MEYLILILPSIFLLFLGEEKGFLAGSIFFLGYLIYEISRFLFKKKYSLTMIFLLLILSIFLGYKYIETKRENEMMRKILEENA